MTEIINKQRRFVVVTCSKEFAEIVEEIPEASMASSITVSDKKIEGAKTLAIVSSEKEVQEVLGCVKLPRGSIVQVIEQSGMDVPACYSCEKNPCDPLCKTWQTMPTINKRQKFIVQESP